jgi:hypothetical protein
LSQEKQGIELQVSGSGAYAQPSTEARITPEWIQEKLEETSSRKWPTRWDGTLLVTAVTSFSFLLPVGGLVVPGVVPCDPALEGWHLFFQALELDAAASKGVAFTRGLEIIFGK